MLSGILKFMDKRHLERIDRDIQEEGGSKNITQVKALSPKSLLNRYGYDKVDFLSIDTEGCELPILKHFDFNEIPVQVISVENGSRSPEIFKYLVSAGYQLAKCVGCDEIYKRIK